MAKSRKANFQRSGASANFKRADGPINPSEPVFVPVDPDGFMGDVLADAQRNLLDMASEFRMYGLERALKEKLADLDRCVRDEEGREVADKVEIFVEILGRLAGRYFGLSPQAIEAIAEGIQEGLKLIDKLANRETVGEAIHDALKLLDDIRDRF